VALDPKIREEMGWPAHFEEWQSMKSTALAKRLRAEDIQVQTGSGAVAPNGCFQKNMLEALKIKEADLVCPNDQQNPRFLKTWEGSIDRAQFLHRASTEKTSEMLAFSKRPTWNGIEGETDLWREMNFVTSAELYRGGPPHREYLCLVPTPLRQLT